MSHRMIRAAARAAGELVCRLTRRRSIRPSGRLVKVNLGSGLWVAPGWINIDASPNVLLAGWPRWALVIAHRLSGARHGISVERYVAALRGGRFVLHDLACGIPLPDGSADYVYSSHLLEHLSLADGRGLTREIHRVLKPGGVVRVCVPDLEYAFELHRRGRGGEVAGFLRGDPAGERLGRHRAMYDFRMLAELLEWAGLVGVRRCRCRRGRVPDIELLDIRPEQTLYVEAERP